MTVTARGTADVGAGDQASPPHPDIDTGLADHVYDIVLLLQQAASDVVRYERFAEDADRAQDTELASWLRELADSDREIVTRASAMLTARLPAAG
jgi:hypothetical protein